MDQIARCVCIIPILLELFLSYRVFNLLHTYYCVVCIKFERMFRFVERKKKYDLWYLMEPDSHPIKSFWLDDIIGEITESSPFAILGSKYDGNAWNDIAFNMPLELLHHINGNAIYNVTNPLLLHIVSELESESHTDFNAIPFDLRISQIILEGSTGRQCAFIFDRYVENSVYIIN